MTEPQLSSILCWMKHCSRPAAEFRLLRSNRDGSAKTTFCWCELHSDRVRENEVQVSEAEWLRHKVLEEVHES